MRIWWVRHGPTHARVMLGWTDLPADLSDTAQLARLSAHLPDAPVISSDLIRATATADAIAGPRPRLPADPALREIHFGRWDGRAFDEIEDSDRPRMMAFWDTPGSVAAPGGESWDDLCTRVRAVVDRLAATGAPDIIAVAHMGTILSQVQRALDIPPYDAFSHMIDPLSVTRIDYGAACTAGPINHLP